MEYFDSNGSLRGMKRDLTDGGVRVPMIAHWTGKIAPGTENDHLSGFQDFLPTVAELLEIEPPKEIDGISYLPTLLGKQDGQEQHPYLYWEFGEKGGKVAVTTKKWKAIRRNVQKKGKAAPLELYDLVNDPGEITDVADSNPDVAKRMAKWIEESHTPL